MPLETRTIGATDVEVTAIGLGGGSLGRASAEEATAIVAAAWDGGVRYFDTAPLYGMGVSEQRNGASLSQQPREEFALSTKVGRLLVPGAASAGDPADGSREQGKLEVEYDYSYDGVHRSFEASLGRLGLDRVDILLCHDIDIWTHGDGQAAIFEAALNGALRALADLREDGTIRAFGLGVNEWQVCSQVMDELPVDCFLLAGRFTLLEQEPLAEFLPKCLDQQVSIIIGGPYNSGLLAVDDRAQATYDYKPVDDARWDRVQQIRAICDAHGVDLRAVALQYPLRHPAVAATIPGAKSVAEVTANLGYFASPIPDELWDDLDAAGLAPRA
jgi:D-threo-aldose 1-dehydrogenase